MSEDIYKLDQDTYENLKIVSEFSQNLSASELLYCEQEAIKQCKIKCILPLAKSPTKTVNFNEKVVKSFKRLYYCSKNIIQTVNIHNKKQVGVFASKDYLPHEPILIYGVKTQKFNVETISSTCNGELLLGPLRCLNTSVVTNAKYLQTSIKSVFILQATKVIQTHEQILVNYKPGFSAACWVISFYNFILTLI